MVFYLQNLSRACKRLRRCSAKSCSRWRETHLPRRACTRPRTTQEHKWSYIWPSYSSCSDKAPDDFSGMFAWAETVLSAPHRCYKVAGRKAVSAHKEIFSELLLQSYSGGNNLAPCARISLLLWKSGAGIWPNRGVLARGKPQKGKHFHIKSAVLRLEGRAMCSAQTRRRHGGKPARNAGHDCLHLLIPHPFERCAQVMHWGSSTSLALGPLPKSIGADDTGRTLRSFTTERIAPNSTQIKQRQRWLCSTSLGEISFFFPSLSQCLMCRCWKGFYFDEATKAWILFWTSLVVIASWELSSREFRPV